MKFEELFANSIELWPEEINISDAASNGEGILFKNLSAIWNQVEERASVMGECYDLMTWIIFKNLHNIAEQNFQEGEILLKKKQVDIGIVKKDLLENLQSADYKDMLEEFENDNK